MHFVLSTFVASFALCGASVAAAAGHSGAVYTLTNSAAGNAVIVFDRAADGTLTAAGDGLTGGLGTGAGLGSQGALTLTANNKWLLAVKRSLPGDDNVSVLACC